MKRFILLKENHCYQQDLKTKKRYEYHFMVERVGLKKIRGKEQQRFTLYSDALKCAKEQAEEEKCPWADTTEINWIMISRPSKKK